ncbi:hypothetical protein bcgnr5384_11830 [Bacillus cereus]
MHCPTQIKFVIYVKIFRVKLSAYFINNKTRRDNIKMDNVSNIDKLESIKSLQSTIRKLENALLQMTEKGANTTLVKKRLKAVCVGLAVLENVWNQESHQYSQEELEEARNVLAGLLPSIERAYDKSKAGSPQRTLLTRRIKALELSIQAIDKLSNK